MYVSYLSHRATSRLVLHIPWSNYASVTSFWSVLISSHSDIPPCVDLDSASWHLSPNNALPNFKSPIYIWHTSLQKNKDRPHGKKKSTMFWSQERVSSIVLKHFQILSFWRALDFLLKSLLAYTLPVILEDISKSIRNVLIIMVTMRWEPIPSCSGSIISRTMRTSCHCLSF